jgi:hypothetical protein
VYNQAAGARPCCLRAPVPTPHPAATRATSLARLGCGQHPSGQRSQHALGLRSGADPIGSQARHREKADQAHLDVCRRERPHKLGNGLASAFPKCHRCRERLRRLAGRSLSAKVRMVRSPTPGCMWPRTQVAQKRSAAHDGRTAQSGVCRTHVPGPRPQLLLYNQRRFCCRREQRSDSSYQSRGVKECCNCSQS